MKDRTLLIAGVAVAGLFLYSRRAAAAQAAASAPRYTTPTAVAAALVGRLIGQISKLDTGAPAGIFAAVPKWDLGSAESGLASWTNYGSASSGGTSTTGDPYSSWNEVTPSKGLNVGVSRFGTDVDQIAAAPVYDRSTDFVQNAPSWQIDYSRGQG